MSVSLKVKQAKLETVEISFPLPHAPSHPQTPNKTCMCDLRKATQNPYEKVCQGRYTTPVQDSVYTLYATDLKDAHVGSTMWCACVRACVYACDWPERSIGSMTSPFFTWSDSPVRELSSTFKSLLCISIPSAGNKSPGNNNKNTCYYGNTYGTRVFPRGNIHFQMIWEQFIVIEKLTLHILENYCRVFTVNFCGTFLDFVVELSRIRPVLKQW